MRNAPVSALIYEFLFDICRLMEGERKSGPLWLPDEDGVLREAFSHHFTSCWEWSTYVLQGVGVLKPLKSPSWDRLTEEQRRWNVRNPAHYYPVMSLDECRDADFSAFETFDNYCVSMWAFSEFWFDDYIHPSDWSPRFMEAVATQDDIFTIEPLKWPKFERNRFEEKVLTQWREANLSKIIPKDRV